jgi:hypothetical protein
MSLEEMKATVRSAKSARGHSREKKACQEAMKVCLEKEITIKGSQEQIRVEIKIGLEEMKATAQASQGKMGANQRKIRYIREHYKQLPHAEVIHLLTAPQAQASVVLHRIHKGMIY